MILYFSGTGNSKYVASLLASKLNDKVISLNDVIKLNDYSGIYVKGNLIIVTPTYAWRIPKIVNNYLEKVDLIDVNNVYFVMTCGGQIGNASKYNRKLCEVKHLQYKGSIGILMPDNYIVMFKSPKKETCIKLIEEVDKKIDKIASIIKSNQNLPTPRNLLYDRIMSSFVNKQFYKYKLISNGFNVNDNCIKCLKCVEKCPLNNIKLIDDKITYGTNCTHCMACLSYCPKNAISYLNKTKNKTPYKIEDFISSK